MDATGTGPKALTIEQLAALRGKTEAVSAFLLKQLTGHLETLRPLLAPRRLLGHHVRSTTKEDVTGADRALAQLRETFRQVCGKPFALPPELDETPLEALENRVVLDPWEYPHDATAEKKTVTITSPLRWVLTYASGYTVSQLRSVLAGREPRRSEHVRQFVVNALVMQQLLARFPGIVQLLGDLRYDLRTETAPGFGALPLLIVTSCLPSFRPADDLILAATRLSGVPAFFELIDVEAVRTLEDPFRTRIEEMLS